MKDAIIPEAPSLCAQ